MGTMSEQLMRDEDYDYLHRLLSKLFEGMLSDDEKAILEEHLTRYPEARQLYMQYVDLEVELSCLVEAEAGAAESKSITFTQITKKPTTALPAPKPKTMGRVFAVAAGVIFAMGLGGFLMMDRDPDPQLARLERVEGKIIIENGQGERIELGVGDTLRQNYVLKTPLPGSTAALRYDDGTVVRLWQESVLVNKQEARKDLMLRRGSLSATVSRQKEKSEMLIRTECATATIVGTQFSAMVGKERTELAVFEGVVRVRHNQQDQSVDVNQGEYVLIGAGDMQLRDIPRPSETWQENFDQPQKAYAKGSGNWNGEEHVQPKGSKGFMQAEKKIEKDGVYYTVSVPPDANGLFAIHEDSKLGFNYRIDVSKPYQISITTRSFQPGKPPEAVYAYTNGDLHGPGVENRWVEACIPFKDFRRISDGSNDPPLGDVVVGVIFKSANTNPQLKVDKVWNTRGGVDRCVIKAVE